MLIPCQEAKEEAAEIKTERKDTEDEDAEMTETGIYILLNILILRIFGGKKAEEKTKRLKNHWQISSKHSQNIKPLDTQASLHPFIRPAGPK